MQFDDGPSAPREELTLDCATCGNATVSVSPDDAASCPTCHRSYSLVVGDGFALLQREGWTMRVILDLPESLARRTQAG